MANFAALVANRGWYITPHLVRSYGDEKQKEKFVKYSQKNYSLIASSYWDLAVEGMWGVVHEAGGTARRAMIDDIAVCGKTGTAENIGEDHSVFISFAPKTNPKIAVAVYIENARGGGGTWAAPIASLVIEKYIKGEVERKEMEQMYMETNPCQPLPLVRKVKKKKN
jgi:penicillin-binding protein 2